VEYFRNLKSSFKNGITKLISGNTRIITSLPLQRITTVALVKAIVKVMKVKVRITVVIITFFCLCSLRLPLL